MENFLCMDTDQATGTMNSSLTLPLTSGVIWGKSLHLSESQLCYQQRQRVDHTQYGSWPLKSHYCSESKISHVYFKGRVTSLRLLSLTKTLSHIYPTHLLLNNTVQAPPVSHCNGFHSFPPAPWSTWLED